MLRVHHTHDGLPFLASNGHWTEEGKWTGAQAYNLRGVARHSRYRTLLQHGAVQDESKAVRRHIHFVTADLRQALRRGADNLLLTRLLNRASVDGYSKTSLLSVRLLALGPPLAVALDWVTNVRNRSAISTLLTGDWFLGRYAGNFFAKDLLPHAARDSSAVDAAGVEASRIELKKCQDFSHAKNAEMKPQVFLAWTSQHRAD